MQNALAEGEWRLVPTVANRMPTAASYLRREGDTEFRAFKFDVLRIEDGEDRRDHHLRPVAVRHVRSCHSILPRRR